MNVWTLSGVVSIAAWIAVAFVAAWPSGLAHVPLAVGAVLIACGIIRQSAESTPPDA